MQDAKARLSELVDKAQGGKPQIVLRRGKPAAAIVSLETFEALQPRQSLVSFLLTSPLLHSELKLPSLDEAYVPRGDLFGGDGA